jgi:hypothetical protein
LDPSVVNYSAIKNGAHQNRQVAAPGRIVTEVGLEVAKGRDWQEGQKADQDSVEQDEVQERAVFFRACVPVMKKMAAREIIGIAELQTWDLPG